MSLQAYVIFRFNFWLSFQRLCRRLLRGQAIGLLVAEVLVKQRQKLVLLEHRIAVHSITCGLLLPLQRGVVCECLSVCLLVTTTSCAETAELIEIPFDVWTRRGPRQPCCQVGVRLPHGKGHFQGSYLGIPDLPRSIFSTLFARGHQRCGLWIPVYCRNLLLLVFFGVNLVGRSDKQ